MNTDKIKGAVDDAAGRARRQVGEWTGDTEEQVKGGAQQIKGKAEKAVGKVRDAVHDATNKTTRDTTVQRDTMDDSRERRDEEIDNVDRE